MRPASSEKLLHSLRAGKPPDAVVLLGSDSYLRELCEKRIIDACVPESMRDWAVTRISAREAGWDEILRRAATVPMLAERQVILVDEAESAEKLGEESRDEILKSLAEYFAEPAPFTLLLIEADALDRRLKFFKLLSEKALIVELSIDEGSAPEWTAQTARDMGVEIDREAAALLAEILNGEPGRIHIELEKLAAYVHPPRGSGRITQRDVEILVVTARRNTVWQLADMLVSRNREGALEFLGNLLREGEEPAGIVGVLAWTYRKLIEAREFPPHTNGYQAARPLQMRPEAAEAAVRQAHRVSKAELLAGIEALAEADSELKSRNPNPRATMEFLIARLTSAPAAKASFAR
ncbi:MAG: DNA polymerase III subunit delta [Acidobacteriota bacterium]|nr:DNA polymerase III subunit delta [Acidobacteriota bacterium]